MIIIVLVITLSTLSLDSNVVWADKMIDTIAVGDNPLGIAYNPDNGNMYVAHSGPHSVSVIDGDTDSVIDTIAVGDAPRGIAYNPDNGNMYVANQGSLDVSVIAVSPIANAGIDNTVDSGQTVQLDGSNSTDHLGGTLTYNWTQIDGPKVTLSDSTSLNPTFTSPLTTDTTDLVFELVVTNDLGLDSEPDSVTIIVNPVIPPTADAGDDQSVDSGSTGQLDGSGSLDPNNLPLTYSWSQTSGPSVTLSNPSSTMPKFDAPNATDDNLSLTFEHVVTNELGVDSEPDNVLISVQPRTIEEIVTNMIKNPLDVNNSFQSAQEIKQIITDKNPDNDIAACDLLTKLSNSEQITDLKDRLRC
ncbi:MAG TPA: PKD domain-containing protein [Candidatus Nitrosocosmicus sp.]|nr:PKD domain-containing protein [Candidatus Nitrosocosmicus sp.]